MTDASNDMDDGPIDLTTIEDPKERVVALLSHPNIDLWLSVEELVVNAEIDVELAEEIVEQLDAEGKVLSREMEGTRFYQWNHEGQDPVPV